MQHPFQGCPFGPSDAIAILLPSGDQLSSAVCIRDMDRSSLRPLPSGRTSQSEPCASWYAIRAPSGDHAYPLTFVLGGVIGRSPLPSARMVKSRPPKGPGVWLEKRMNAIVPVRFGAPASLGEFAVSATAAPVSRAKTHSLDTKRTILLTVRRS